jgi:hypothetical protein
MEHAPSEVMRYLKLAIVIATLASTLTGCYVETHDYYHPHHPYCAYGYYWDGYRCRHY